MSKGTLNKAILIGHVGDEPEIKYLASGMANTVIRIATNECWKDKNGQVQEHTEWHSIVMWDKLAERAAEYFHKGMLLYVEGRIQTRSYEKEGQKKYFTEIVARDVQMLSQRNQTQGRYEEAPVGQSQSAPQDDRDIPF